MTNSLSDNRLSLNKSLPIIGAIVLILIIAVIIVMSSSKKNIKLAYEINLEDVDVTVDMINIPRNEGINCGNVTLILGQELDINPYILEAETVINNTEVKQLLAPSKKYEVVVIGYPGSYRIYEIRTTVPTVYSTRGFTIGDEYSVIKDTVNIKKKKKVTYKDKGYSMNMEFISDILVVLDLKCI